MQGPLEICGVSSGCEKGHYCMNGVKFPCAAGTFGSSAEETSFFCSGPCPEGSFCPEGSARCDMCCRRNLQRGALYPRTLFSLFVLASGSHVCTVHLGARTRCRVHSSLQSYGPAQLMTLGAHTLRGAKALVLCLAAAESNRQKTNALVVPARVSSLPSSRPATSPIPCGNNTVYCPAGSSRPTAVSSGNYTLGGTSDAGRTAEEVCPKGRYCHQGLAVLCPPGTFGEREGLDEAACSGPCPAGERRGVGALRAAEVVGRCSGLLAVLCDQGVWEVIP